MKKLKCILLVDDDEITNFYNQHLIRKMGIAETVETSLNGREAIQYLTTPQNGEFPNPDMVLLDINMPIMNGFEFLEAHDSLPAEQRARSVFMMLTTDLMPEDKSRTSKSTTLSGFFNKPLSEEELENGIQQHQLS
jgi:CheY-like chemotaxis protein